MGIKTQLEPLSEGPRQIQGEASKLKNKYRQTGNSIRSRAHKHPSETHRGG